MKRSVEMSAPAKVNLYLDVTGRRADGYHNIESVMQSVSLCDAVTVSVDTGDTSGVIKVSCTDETIPADEGNICCKAARAFFDYTLAERCAVSVRIVKNIPSQAGLGGGSADAAAVIAALDRLLGTGCDAEQLCNICAGVGADVPACLLGGTLYCTGIGDIITPLPHLPGCFIVIAKGTQGISTAEAYGKIDSRGGLARNDIRSVFCSGDIRTISENCRNIFEEVTDLPEVGSIKETMLGAGALCAMMTGSGSAVFGIFDSQVRAEAAAAALKGEFFTYIAQPVNEGVHAVS